ncbi:hypothetical protein [Lawsonibacter hominis]|uniref:Tail fiber protein n=1 Tax=Lawsonibacter hominis TaxID=2763053 RepID=A0A8J6J7E2_9FIRM|nr:hypothetical protein [Lawsonibacter hominis]MBC5735073.1 hypothetical protein [Lawsonibacter hominis]
MSVQSEIDRLNAAKTSLAAAIADQGVEVPGDAGLEDYAALVASIKTGGIPVVTTAGTGNAYTATVEGITELYNGLTLVLIPHVSSSAFIPTLNLNGLGAVQIRRTYSSTTMGNDGGFYQNWLYESVPVLISYDASNPRWIVHTMSKPEAIDLKGIVPASKGGTGKQSLTSGSYLVGNGTAAVQLKTPAQVREDIGTFFTVTYNTTTYAEARAAVLAGQMPVFRKGTDIGVCVQAPASETDTTQFVFLIKYNQDGGDYYTLSSNNSYGYYRSFWLSKFGGTLTGALTAAEDTAPATAKVRNTALVSTETAPTVNGVINWTYA